MAQTADVQPGVAPPERATAPAEQAQPDTSRGGAIAQKRHTQQAAIGNGRVAQHLIRDRARPADAAQRSDSSQRDGGLRGDGGQHGDAQQAARTGDEAQAALDQPAPKPLLPATKAPRPPQASAPRHPSAPKVALPHKGLTKRPAPHPRDHGGPALRPPPLVALPDPLPKAPPEPRRPGSRAYDPLQARAEVDTLLAQFAEGALRRKLALRGRASAVKTQIAADGAQQKKVALAAATQTENDIAAEVKAARTAVAGHVKTARALATVQAIGQWGKLLTATGKQATAFDTSKKTHQAAALKQVTDRQAAARKFGVDEGRRGREAIQKQVKDALDRGQTRAASYPKDERGQVQSEAATTVARETAAGLQKAAKPVEDKAVEQGQDLADGFKGAADKAVEAIGEQAPQLIQQLMVGATGQLKPFQSVGETTVKAIDAFGADVTQRLDGVERDARREMTSVRSEVGRQFDGAVRKAQAAIDGETAAMESAIDQLVGRATATAQSATRPDPAALRQGLRGVEGMIGDAAGTFDAGLGELKDRADASYAAASAAATGDLAKVGSTTVAHLGSAVTTANRGIDDVLKKEDEELGKSVKKWDEGLGEGLKATEAKWDELVTGVGSKLDEGMKKGRQNITKSVDDAVKENDKPLAKLDEKMTEAAKDAAWAYDHPIKAKLWGVLKGVGKALLVIVAIVLIIKLALALIASGIVALIVIGIILIVAVVAVMVYFIVTGIIKRVSSGTTTGEKVWGFFVGIFDIVGIPNIIEGITEKDIVNGSKLSKDEAGERLGGGIVALLGAFLFAKSVRGMRGAPKVPIDVAPEIRPPIDPLEAPTDPLKGDPAKSADVPEIDKAEPEKTTEPDKSEPEKKAEPDKSEPEKKAEPDKSEPDKAEPEKKAEPDKSEPEKKAEPDKSEPEKKAEPDKAEPEKKAEPDKADADKEAKKAAKKADAEKAKADREAKKAAEKAESDAKKAAEKAESDAKKAAEKAESDAKKAVEKAERDAKKAAEKAERDAKKAAEKAAKKAAAEKKAAEKAADDETAQVGEEPELEENESKRVPAEESENWEKGAKVKDFIGKPIKDGWPEGYRVFKRGGKTFIRRIVADDAKWPRLTVDEAETIQKGKPGSTRVSVPGKLAANLGDRPPKHQAHHVVPDEVVKSEELYKEAMKRDPPYDIDRESNGEYLPEDEAARAAEPASQNRPLHSGSHSTYSGLVREFARQAEKRLLRRFGALKDVPTEVLEEACADVEDLARDLMDDWTTTRGEKLK